MKDFDSWSWRWLGSSVLLSLAHSSSWKLSRFLKRETRYLWRWFNNSRLQTPGCVLWLNSKRCFSYLLFCIVYVIFGLIDGLWREMKQKMCKNFRVCDCCKIFRLSPFGLSRIAFFFGLCLNLFIDVEHTSSRKPRSRVFGRRKSWIEKKHLTKLLRTFETFDKGFRPSIPGSHVQSPPIILLFYSKGLRCWEIRGLRRRQPKKGRHEMFRFRSDCGLAKRAKERAQVRQAVEGHVPDPL